MHLDFLQEAEEKYKEVKDGKLTKEVYKEWYKENDAKLNKNKLLKSKIKEEIK